MALPLAATLQPIEQPFPVAAEAEMLMVYPQATAEDVVVDFYLDLQEPVVATYPTTYVYGSQLIGVTSEGDVCELPIYGVSTPGFTLTTGLSTLSLTWLDVAAFFWFDGPGELVSDFTPPDVDTTGGSIGQPCPPPEVAFCLPGEATPLAPTLGESICPPGSVIWADALDPWDSGLTCWDQPV